MGIFYFLAGFLACYCGLYVYAFSTEEGKEHRRARQRPWTKVNNLRWETDFDFEFTEVLSANDVAILTARTLEVKVKKSGLTGISISPGSYTVRISAHASFVEREKDSK